jgi:hypothetical protein
MYFAEIWGFLIFIGGSLGVIFVLVGVILWFTEANMKRRKGLVFAGILLSTIIRYFMMCPPSFAVTYILRLNLLNLGGQRKESD